MSDDLHSVPPPDDDHRDDDLGDYGELERALHALLAPVPAPRAFRERLKAELLRDAGSLMAGDGRPAGRVPRHRRWVGAPVAALTAHPRITALASAALTLAAALLLSITLRGLVPQLKSEMQPRLTATASPTSAPTSAPVAAPRATPTVTPATPPPTATRSPTAAPTAPPPTATRSPTAPPPTRSPTAAPTVPPTATRRPSTFSTARRAARTPAAGPVVTPASREVATPTPAPSSPTVPAPTPVATATARVQPSPTAMPSPTATVSPTARPPARVVVIPVPARATPTLPAAPRHAVSRPHRRHAARGAGRGPGRLQQTNRHGTRPGTLPNLGVHIGPLPTPPPSATATARPTPTATPRPTPRPSATPRPTATATPSPTATTRPNVVQIPLGKVDLPVPNPGNGLLSSPLEDALTDAQPVSYSIPLSWTLPAMPPTLPVYPLRRTAVSTADALTIAHHIKAQRVLLAPRPQADGSVMAAVRVDGVPYTLTVYGGYGGPWFTLRSRQPGVGYPSAARLAVWADRWLRGHHLARSDLHVLVASDGSVYYGQAIAGVPLLGPSAAQLSFDGHGVLRGLRYEYVTPPAAIQWPAQTPNAAAASAVEQGQGLYRGPATAIITGTAAVTGIALGYVGVHGPSDYLEPVYVLSGSVPAARTLEPFSLYVPALQPVALPPPTATP